MEIFIEISERCNANCRFCPRKTLVDTKCLPDMTLEEADECMLYGKKWSQIMKTPVSLRLNGHGEPLLNKDIVQIINKACTIYDTVTFSTNGLALLPELVDKIIETGISGIKFSVTGFHHKIYNMFQGYGSKDDQLRNKVYDNIKYLINKRNDKLHKLKISLMYILTEETKEDFYDFIDYWDNKVDEIIISCLNFYNRELEGFVNRKKTEQKIFRTCDLNSTGLLLRVDGSISPCCGDYNKTFVVGNYKKQTPKELYNSSEFVNARCALSQTLDFNSLPDLCKTCETITLENKNNLINGSKMQLFDIDKVVTLKGIPLVLYGANNLLLSFLAKIKLYDDINSYDFLIVDGFKEGKCLPPLCYDEDKFSKYEIHKPSLEVFSNRRILVFSIKKFDEIRLKLEKLGLLCEPSNALFCDVGL